MLASARRARPVLDPRLPSCLAALAAVLAAGCGRPHDDGGGGASGGKAVSGPASGEGTAPAARWPATDDTVLEQIAATYSFRLGVPAGVWVAPDGSAVLYRRSGPRSFESDLYSFDTATGHSKRLLSAQELLRGSAENLSPEEKARRERQRMATRGITAFSASDDGARLIVPLSGRLFLIERATGAFRELPTQGSSIDPQISPDGKRVALVQDGDVYVVDTDGGAAHRLTTRASKAVEYGAAEFVAQEEMSRFHGSWWSPDSRLLAYQKTDASDVEVLHVADATHPEQAPTPFRYPRPGRANADVALGVAAVDTGKTVWVRWDSAGYPYLATVKWPRHGPLTIVVQNRAQSEEKVLAVDPRSGRTTELLTERDDAWLNLDQTVPEWLPDGSGFLWSSERSGAWELELRGRDGALVRTVMPGALGYRKVAGVEPDGRAVWVEASADPRQSHVYRVPLDGSAAERMTPDEGSHDIVRADDSGVYVLVSKDGSGAQHHHVRRADGSEIGQLESVAEKPALVPQPELVTVKAGGRDYRAAVVRPRQFEKGRRYPVIVSVYGGPHQNMVVLDPHQYLTDQWYADAGFIVVRADGRGTPGRGRAWERAIRGDLVKVALADQVAVLQALAATRPEMDLGRVGITGWSFGGYMSAMAVLLRPDVFRAGAAGAPVTDWRDYDTHYTERYMGLLPQSEAAYDAASALTYASKLERPLLLVHGTTDDNVYFTHSLKLTQALFRAGKPFEMLPLAGFTHMVPDPAVKKALQHRILEFLRRNL
ncbi:MAG TPA: DPP IV N-terminal domain-containing protein [Kofleriaceae bacterium]|nr:DPP IV N-terminal domain-containing protein [Kofleriaceae bacterium]